jgi:cellulose synthase/poly-beta-1,6-N-acetylglucosamine synthase-like glycosyltransferase/spore germination protein YaaH/peptidoglycan/xylan/chitin deacetylase (PgdA/CDA1 family)
MMEPVAQIFQTNSSGRWNRFKWSFRILGVVFLFFVAVFVIAIVNIANPSLPRLQDRNEVYKRILNPNNLTTLRNQKNKRFQSFLQFMHLKDSKTRSYTLVRKKKIRHNHLITPILDSQIRAAFYVPWDDQSYYSLKANGGFINMVFPEWIFINPKNDSLETRIDQRALRIMQDSTITVLPIFSNHYFDDFDHKAVMRIIHSKKETQKVITQLVTILKKYNFRGVNVDLENVAEKTNEPLTEFQRQLYEKLHAAGFLVTMDVPVFDDDYDYGQLARYNDYLVIMAYDQHDESSGPGNISDQHWIEGAIADVAKKGVPAKKMIMGLAGYGGYDWPLGAEGSDLTYQEALSVAKLHDSHIDFDGDSYNLHYNYKDDDNISHDVYFTDAATNFNTMRFASEYGMSGAAIWRLGSEDYRIWSFYDRDLSDSAIKKHPVDFDRLANVTLSNKVDYTGEGEVLDVQSTPQTGRINLEIDSADMLITGQDYIKLPSMFVIKQFGKEDNKMVLTFDDGPDPRYTPRILKILEDEHVPAAFFVIGINAENNIPLVKREYREGYEIGNHTFTHPNIALINPRLADYEIRSTRLLIECITGHSTILFRAPYNADSQPRLMIELIPVAMARTQNYYTIGENIDPEDWDVGAGVNADSIFNRVVRMRNLGNIILLHDAGGNREATVQALPRIIHYFKSHGYTFTTVGDLMGKTRDQIMPAVSDKEDYYLIKLNYWFATLTYWANHLLYALFIVGIALSIGRIVILGVIAYLENKRTKKEQAVTGYGLRGDLPLVSVVVPAYNEELNAIKTLQTLLESDYGNLEVIFVDDGSKDSTYSRVLEAFRDDSRVNILTKSNGGKASALNYGINMAKGSFLLCIDADTQLKTDAVSRLMEMFADDKVGAVAGNVKVGNEVNLLTVWQSIEYITSQNFDRRAFDLLNCITVVPGAIGIFRKEAIFRAGGFTSDTLAEDCDLTIRILRSGYVIRNCTSALSFTEAPETLRMFFKQRFRWCFGVMQCFWKHRDTLFNPNYKGLGLVAMPNILVYQILLPLLAPLADIILVFGMCVLGNASRWHILQYYLVFLIVDAGAAVLAFAFEKEKYSKLWWVIPQRLVYRVFMYLILFKSWRKAMKGELQHWGVLKRTGNVQPTLA